MDLSPAGLAEVAERGSFTAAATALGYTQSGISRQAAALEREAGKPLFERHRTGVHLTPAGLTLLRHARVVLDALEAARRDLDDDLAQRVRLGSLISTGAVLVPTALAALRRTHPALEVSTREGTTPALVRAIRAGSLDLAVITSRPPHRPPDTELPRLIVEQLSEVELLVAAPATGRFAGRATVTVAELVDAPWIASPAATTEPLLGVWPGLPGRPHIAHRARDWLARLALVAAGCGLTTVPSGLFPAPPPEVITLRVVTGSHDRAATELRRLSLIRTPAPLTPAIAAVIEALRSAATPFTPGNARTPG
ncbi:LysR family transcriptional regulator [Nocardia nova]|uniref:LysR family transcriptional regulator n=1 Tax=Nocardia nova TaxID=37330 RepID=A0A2S6AB67_9NOCA|nr:LysR family transcriptional regulator [Nocardia nova]PPJ19530.1 LysR family transcriptional regulator [Nocardia nova]PPJ30735.1 LysR family transcriptional regulator [Nocardia nova]